MIDLHTHTTCSDGRCAPAELVARAHAAGIRTMSVTDHDTMAGVAPAMRAAADANITVIPGIEITAVHGGKDVHVLAYFLPAPTPELESMLARQRQLRIERAAEIGGRLARLGVPVDVASLVASASTPGARALARPQIAEALVAAGHVESVSEAFDRYLGEDSPAYVPHQGASPAAVVEVASSAGALTSLAHPGYRPRDEIIPGLVDAGLTAIEAFHSSHDAAAERHYLALARSYRLLVTGGSDYHGPGTRRAEFFGCIALPQEHFDALVARATGPIDGASGGC